MKFQVLPYNQSLALLTDLYELTMAYGFWKAGIHEKETVFHLFFRKNPFKGGFTIACGLELVVDYLENFSFEDDDLAYLETLTGNDEKPLFENAFLDYLQQMMFSSDIDAIPEGTVVFSHEPLLRIQGPIIQCQLLESVLLNIINFQTLIATKAARICGATNGEPVLEFGLRRAQGIDGGLSASRAAYVGGCAATSNVLAGKIYGIPVKGTHAHSWVMLFDNELESFRKYAEAMPNNCVFLVDTYDTLEGVRNAIEVGGWLREHGHEMVGIRLDSGDLAHLSIQARQMLDEAGFLEAVIVASNDLDEEIIGSLKEQGAKIALWGVGTKLVTGHDQPALAGVYKLGAVQNRLEWQNKIKLSEQSIKISNPGRQQVRRYYTETENIGDAIYDIETDLSQGCIIVDQLDPIRRKTISPETKYRDLLVPVFRLGESVYEQPSLEHIRDEVQENLKMFHDGMRRIVNPHQYLVGLEKSLYDLKTEMIFQARNIDE